MASKRRMQVSVAGRKVSMTLDQAARVNQRIAEYMRLEKSLAGLVNEGWIPTYLRRSGLPISWAWAYEFTLGELVALTAFFTGKSEELAKAVTASDHHEQILSVLDDLEEGQASGRQKKRQVVVVLALLYALSYSARAIGYHSLSINELVSKGLNGDETALRQAVAVDGTVLAMPSVAAYVAKLQLSGDRRRLAAIYRAAANGPNKQLAPNWQLRYMERVLAEGGVIEAHGKDAVFDLITKRLRLYDSRGEEPSRGLFTAFQRWRESAST